ncbi:phosphoheptose isomerase [Candidatus Peribacteria bacterium RIFCSPHIGHO2_01_FULL_51_9]|nr:MAG: phosphoheptose isomerase [Candidatus Peribacteria bacterium RIFCSPHIGHO2_01_FULL_51_9]
MDEAPLQAYVHKLQETLSTLDMGPVARFVDLLMETYEAQGSIYIFGNGGSGATASHACGDFVKGISYGLKKKFRMLCLNDNLPTLSAVANDISYDDIFVEPLSNFLGKNDLVIGLSGSGNSTNVVKALAYAKERGARTVALCGYTGGKIKNIATLCVHVPVKDMEITEDAHMIVLHAVKQTLMEKLGAHSTMGAQYDVRVRGEL